MYRQQYQRPNNKQLTNNTLQTWDIYQARYSHIFKDSAISGQTSRCQ